jgi:hypothetical protein
MKVISEKAKGHSRAYSILLGKPVVLVIVTHTGYIPIPCSIVAVSAAAIRIRIPSGWKMDLRKESILGVEQDSSAVSGSIN